MKTSGPAAAAKRKVQRKNKPATQSARLSASGRHRFTGSVNGFVCPIPIAVLAHRVSG